MNARALKRDAARERIPSGRNWTAFDKFSKLVRKAMTGSETICSAFTLMEERTIGVTQPCGSLYEGIEHRLQIERRSADHLEHIGGGGLLLEAFAQLAKGTRVLDRDDGLLGDIWTWLDMCF